MNVYNLRKNIFVNFEEQNSHIKGKVVFKTQSTKWLGTKHSSIVPISIHSSFHEGVCGRMKMEGLFTVIKKYVSGEIIILLTELAHVQVLKLLFPEAPGQCEKDAKGLYYRYADLFAGCHVVFWKDFVQKNPLYHKYKEKIANLFQTDLIFSQLVLSDAEQTYTYARKELYTNKKLYIEKTCEDILEQCVALLIINQKKIRYQFYPGKQYASIEYLTREVIFIDVFIAIEKKRISKVANYASIA